MLDKMEFHRTFVSELEVKYGFTIESLEEFWNITKSRSLQPLSAGQLKISKSYASTHLPNLITRDQFKLMMMQTFKVTDVKLATHIFMVADEKNEGALDVTTLIANILFWLKGDLANKWMMYFYINSSLTNEGHISPEHAKMPLA